MEKSVSLDQKISNKIISIISAIILGIGSFLSFTSTFSIGYSLKNCFSGGLVGGLIKTVNDIAETLGNRDYILLKQYAGSSDSGGMFLTFVMIISIIVSYLVIRSNNRKLYLIYLLPLIIANLFFTVETGYIPVLIMVLGIFLGWIGTVNGGSISLWNFIAAVLIVVAVVGISSLSIIKGAATGAALPKTLDSYITKTVENLRFGSNPLGNGALEPSKREAGDEVALTINMSTPQSMYLRGYVGELYSGGQWNDLRNSDYYNSLELVKALENNDFNGLGQLVTAAQLSGAEITDNEVSIKIENASSKYAYIPYEINGTVDGFKNWGNSFLTSPGIFGEKEYSYSITSNLTGRWTDITGQLFSASGSEAISSYNVDESYNNVDVYDKYTKLNDSVVSVLAKEIGTRGNQEKGHIDYKTAIGLVRDFFDDKVVYSESRTISQDENYLKYFFEYKKGYDVDYATVATLMFRYYGIPARYVEGYLVTTEDVSQMKPEGSLDIPLSNAHSWTEIYVDTIGWVPIEVCSNYYGVMEDADLTKGLESNNNINPFNQVESGRSQEVIESTDKNDDKTSLGYIFKFIGIGLLAILVIVIIWLAIRRIIKLVKRNRLFNQADRKQAISYIYEYCVSNDVPLEMKALDLGLEAGYSNHAFSEEDREYMLNKFSEGKRKRRENKKKNNINRVRNFVNRLAPSRVWNRKNRKQA